MTEIVRHRFLDHKINPQTETLIIGTFNPDTPANKADFFYSTGRNYLWCLLPRAFGENPLKQADKAAKLDFVRDKRIDFIDLISAVQVDQGKEGNRADKYIDKKVLEWRDVIREIDTLGALKRACFTRRRSSDIPQIRSRLEKVENYLLTKRGIKLKYLISPARYYNEAKQSEWSTFLCS